jgi:rhamnose utilization protein RhaD (predicted bifunctional aldolase and dehydrogenase)
MGLNDIVELSHFYGSNAEYVVAGGGNTSYKDGNTLYIKGSGAALGDIRAGDFVKMDRAKLARIWQKNYSPNHAEREAAVLADLMAARMAGEEGRPSVETLLHDLLPYTLVVHLHPALVNGLTCGREGERAAGELFAGEAIWIPSTNPGYTLSLEVKNALEAHSARHQRQAAIILLQNHGVFAGADTAEGIRSLYRRIMDAIGARITEQPVFSPVSGPSFPPPGIGDIGGQLGDWAGRTGSAESSPWHTVFENNTGFAPFIRDRISFDPLHSAYTPDHIVYAGSDPLFVETGGPGEQTGKYRDAWKGHLERTKRVPKIAAFQGLGVFGLGPSEKAARLALELFTDSVKVAIYTRAFGGPLFMDADKIDFINNWEVERYRSQISGITQKDTKGDKHETLSK